MHLRRLQNTRVVGRKRARGKAVRNEGDHAWLYSSC